MAMPITWVGDTGKAFEMSAGFCEMHLGSEGKALEENVSKLQLLSPVGHLQKVSKSLKRQFNTETFFFQQFLIKHACSTVYDINTQGGS